MQAAHSDSVSVFKSVIVLESDDLRRWNLAEVGVKFFSAGNQKDTSYKQVSKRKSGQKPKRHLLIAGA